LGLWVLALWLTPWVSVGTAGEETLDLRIAWGGGAEAQWQGFLAVTEGALSDPRPLGIEADEPGSMWLERGPLPIAPPGGSLESTFATQYLAVRQRSRRTYDGVDLRVTAPLEAKLLLTLSKGEDREPRWITMSLADLVDKHQTADLDDRGNWVLVARCPGDRLRVRVAHRSLVFAPGEALHFELRPYLLTVDAERKVRIEVELADARAASGRLIAEHAVEGGRGEPIDQVVPLPEVEGAYDVVIRASHVRGWLRRAQPLVGNEPIAERRIQVLVLDSQAPAASEGTAAAWQMIEEIDPANPKWWERFAKLPHLGRFPRLWKGPLGSGNSQVREHSLGRLVALSPSGKPDDVAWEAYTLPIHGAGRPHLLEVDYPSDVPQSMGISIVEPNAAGGVFPIGLDSGVDRTERLAGPAEDARWMRHRLIFWPKTRSPIVLVTNQHGDGPVVYGKMRVYAAAERLPRAFPLEGPPPQRLLAAYLDRPLFPENFSASESLATSSELSVDDWVTFYEGGTRLVEYLNHVGLGGLMISVLADGSTIYPSALTEPTPHYDTGVFQDAGQDPIRKDVLEMLLRLFDRERLQLIPALEFGSPLPEVEALLRRGGPESEGIVCVGPHGRTWLETYRPLRGKAPYYNALHPEVQAAMLSVVREVVERYGGHPSFAGLAVHLSAYGYAQLPGPGWGMDDWTMAQFERDTQIRVPGEGPARFAQRERFLSTKYPRQWLAWRAGKLAEFHRRIRDELTAVRPDARLYLAGADMLSGEESQRDLLPSLPRRMTMGEAMLRVGVDVAQYARSDDVVLLRPERISPRGPLAHRAVNLELRQMFHALEPGMGTRFEEMSVPGSLFFHEPREIRVASFDAKSPFQPAYTSLVTQTVPSGDQNRRRLVRSLADLDAQVVFDGGCLLPLGQEESVRDLVAAFRLLPAVRFERLTGPGGGDPAQPVTIRYATHGGATYVCLLNDAPFACTLRLEVDAPIGCRIEELRSWRRVRPLTSEPSGTFWTVELKPYDLVAVRLSAPKVSVLSARVALPPEVPEQLELRIDDLQNRTAALRNLPPLFDVLGNPQFELPPTKSERIPGWIPFAGSDGIVELDQHTKWRGEQSVRMVSRGEPVRLMSRPFDAPSTGRLTVSFRLCAAEGPQSPTVKYWLEEESPRGDFRRWHLQEVQPGWQLFIVEANDLPLRGLSPLRVRFDLTGPGEVWLDDVLLTDRAFNASERNELFKLVSPADYQLQNGQIRDCMQLLEGYWPQFLLANMPAPEAPLARKPDPPARKAEKTERGMLDRLKRVVPKRISLF